MLRRLEGALAAWVRRVVVTDLDGVRIKLAMARANARRTLTHLRRAAVEAAQSSIVRVPSENPTQVSYQIEKVPWIDPTWSATFGQGILQPSVCPRSSGLATRSARWSRTHHRDLLPTVGVQGWQEAEKLKVDIPPEIKRKDILAAVEQMQPYHSGGRREISSEWFPSCRGSTSTGFSSLSPRCSISTTSSRGCPKA